ncbi:MAG: hypothetical protein Q7R22_005280 [Verrucomicrobiota bacterium JB025]|nr:hypothetical protein [Verrucomicrobiota bacterium JB025]
MLRIVPLPDEMCRGHLFLGSMPGRFEPLDIFLQTIVTLRVAHVLCLVSDEEIARKSPDYHAAIQRNEIPVKLLECSPKIEPSAMRVPGASRV